MTEEKTEDGKDEDLISLVEMQELMKERLNKDVDLCARWGFGKLDIV